MHMIKPFLPGYASDTTSKNFASRFMITTLISDPEAFERFSLLMENREMVEMLIVNLEKYEDERGKKLRKEKSP